MGEVSAFKVRVGKAMAEADATYTRHSVTITADVLRDRDVMVALGDAAMDAWNAAFEAVSVDGDTSKGALTVVWFLHHDRTQIKDLIRENAALRKAWERVVTDWQWGAWADAPRRADRAEERLANAQYVTDWLRDRSKAALSAPPARREVEEATDG